MAKKKGIDVNSVILVIVIVLVVGLSLGVFYKAPVGEAGEGELAQMAGRMQPGAPGSGGVGDDGVGDGGDAAGEKAHQLGVQWFCQINPGFNKDDINCICHYSRNSDKEYTEQFRVSYVWCAEDPRDPTEALNALDGICNKKCNNWCEKSSCTKINSVRVYSGSLNLCKVQKDNAGNFLTCTLRS